MASQKNLVYLQNKETGEVRYTRKNKKLVERKLKYKKYSKKLRKVVLFEEVKKPVKKKKATPEKAKSKKVEVKASKSKEVKVINVEKKTETKKKR